MFISPIVKITLHFCVQGTRVDEQREDGTWNCGHAELLCNEGKCEAQLELLQRAPIAQLVEPSRKQWKPKWFQSYPNERKSRWSASTFAASRCNPSLFPFFATPKVHHWAPLPVHQDPHGFHWKNRGNPCTFGVSLAHTKNLGNRSDFAKS